MDAGRLGDRHLRPVESKVQWLPALWLAALFRLDGFNYWFQRLTATPTPTPTRQRNSDEEFSSRGDAPPDAPSGRSFPSRDRIIQRYFAAVSTATTKWPPRRLLYKNDVFETFKFFDHFVCSVTIELWVFTKMFGLGTVVWPKLSFYHLRRVAPPTRLILRVQTLPTPGTHGKCVPEKRFGHI